VKRAIKKEVKLIPVKDARRILNKNSIGAVYDLVRNSVIPPGVVVKLGRAIWFNEAKLIEFIENGGTLSIPQKSETQNQEQSLQTAPGQNPGESGGL
jgi:hypothetical protein